MFDLNRVRKESGLSEADLKRLELRVRDEFPSDELMFEIHFLRAVQAFKEGWVSIEDLFRDTAEA